MVEAANKVRYGFSDFHITDDEVHFVALMKYVADNLRFDSHKYHLSYLKRRVHSRMFITRIPTYDGYLQYIEGNEEEQHQLLKNLTVNVTRFFRNALVFKEIRDVVLPELFRSKKEGKGIKIWCAGCSSGEEPYTIAIILCEILHQKKLPEHIKIFGTDIDQEAINKAMIGEYTQSQLSETEPYLVDKYFIPDGDVYILKDGIRDSVTFVNHDLFNDSLLAGMDIIVCRNVVIYFNQEAKENLYEGFYSCLNNYGYFIMGKSELLTGTARNKFHFVNSDEKIYQKRE
ncbi:protein-glutamate O-methyltransferase CheR [Candidatus Woesearchaeota archaeon]|nr:protein-glutamate O-methyltransferase CheR [Candidatus Woesearchaeota archaeon]